jgi:hypothetical protein
MQSQTMRGDVAEYGGVIKPELRSRALKLR